MEQDKINAFYSIIKESGEFDEDFYINSYPDVNESGYDPITHYIVMGAKKLYNPSQNFNTDYYLFHHKDLLKHVKKVGLDNFNPLVHYIQYGKKENRQTRLTNTFFDVDNLDLIKNSEIIHNRLVLFEKSMEFYDAQLDSVNELLNMIFSNYDIKSKGILRLEQILSLELLKLFDKFCKRNNLEYWLSAGTLLGAIRHKGYIPWDDDIDVCMMRKDFDLFLDNFLNEISHNDFLKENITIDYHLVDENWEVNPNFVLLFAQVIFKKPLVKFDIFIHDYVEYSEKFKTNYAKYRKDFLNDIINKKYTVQEAILKYNYLLGVSYEKKDLVINALDSYPTNRIYSYNTIFPLKYLEFENYKFLCPNNEDIVLKEIFGKDYMTIPKIIASHNRVAVIKSQFSQNENVEEIIRLAIVNLKENIEELYADEI